MSNLMELQLQIEKLQKEAAEIRSKEFVKTVADIRAQMNAFGITLKDLQPSKRNKVAGSTAKDKPGSRKPRSTPGERSKAAGKPVEAKFRGPNGETWSGRGLSPRWLAVLVEQGASRDDFLIKKAE